MALRDKCFKHRIITLKTVRLAGGFIPFQSQPIEIGLNGIGKGLRRAFAVSVVEPQYKLAVMFFGEQETEQSGAGIADMQQSRWAGGEARSDGHLRATFLISVSASTRLETRW